MKTRSTFLVALGAIAGSPTRGLCALGCLGLAAIAINCSGGSSSPTSPTSTTPVDTTTITIASGGTVTPANIRVAVGSRVTITNNDNRAHDMNSDPHPAHTECPAINWGNLQPGQSAQSSALTTARTCGFHDHNLPDSRSLQGTIQIQ